MRGIVFIIMMGNKKKPKEERAKKRERERDENFRRQRHG